MKRLGVIQPHLSNTSREMFLELARYCPLDLVTSPEPRDMGFTVAPIAEGQRVRYFSIPTVMPLGKRFGWIQWGVVKYILREKPGELFLNANPRYLSFWLALVWARILGIPVYVHGHGFYRRRRNNACYKFMMKAMLRLVTSYICYAPIVRQAFLDNGFSGSKLRVAHNSLINRFPVRPHEKAGEEKGVLFIGRLRRDSELELLMHVMKQIRQEDGMPLLLHVIGDGEEAAGLRERARDQSWVIFHGSVYEAEKIRNISLQCFAGCYPGNAGLSVVHMLSLSLPVITHNDLRLHGPEPSFLRDGVTALLYDHSDPERSLYEALRSLACDPARVARMQQNAFADYQSLSNPSLAERLWTILRENQSQLSATVPEELAPPAELSPAVRTETAHSQLG